jgi:inner membrane protein
MPSPIGHMLGGAIAGHLVAGRRDRGWPAPGMLLLAFAGLGALADFDLLVGAHSGPSHSVGSTAVVGTIALLIFAKRPRMRGPLRLAVAAAAAYATHPLLDWLSTDTSAPFGIMALWPFSTEYYLSPYRAFLPMSRKYWLAEAWLGNLRALIRELLILGPIFWVVWWIRSGAPAARMRSSS